MGLGRVRFGWVGMGGGGRSLGPSFWFAGLGLEKATTACNGGGYDGDGGVRGVDHRMVCLKSANKSLIESYASLRYHLCRCRYLE